jgi:hypothetical protein
MYEAIISPLLGGQNNYATKKSIQSCAEPHAGWHGGWRLDTSGYPIRLVVDSDSSLYGPQTHYLKVS